MSGKNTYFDCVEYSDIYAVLSDGSKLYLHRVILARSSCEFLRNIIKYPQIDSDGNKYIELTASEPNYIRSYIESKYDKNKAVKITSPIDFSAYYDISHAYLDKSLKYNAIKYFIKNIKLVGEHDPTYLFEVAREISLLNIWGTSVIELDFFQYISEVKAIFRLHNKNATEIIDGGFEEFLSDSDIVKTNDPMKYIFNLCSGDNVYEYILSLSEIGANIKNILIKFNYTNVYFGSDDFHSVMVDKSISTESNYLLVTSLKPFKYRVYYYLSAYAYIHLQTGHIQTKGEIKNPIINYSDCQVGSKIYTTNGDIYTISEIHQNSWKLFDFMRTSKEYDITVLNINDKVVNDFDGAIMCKYSEE